MNKLLLLLVLSSCELSDDTARSRFADKDVWCDTVNQDIVLCTHKGGKNYICFATKATAFCIEAIDPITLK